MESGLSAVLVLASFLAVSQATTCGRASRQLYACFSVNIDFSRSEDPEYHPEMCRLAKQSVACVTALHQRCPDSRVWQGDMLKNIQDMTVQMQAMCPDKPVKNCQDIAVKYNTCVEILKKADQSKMCSAKDGYVSCMNQLKVDCAGHPMMRKINVDKIIADMNAMTESFCQQ